MLYSHGRFCMIFLGIYENRYWFKDGSIQANACNCELDYHAFNNLMTISTQSQSTIYVVARGLRPSHPARLEKFSETRRVFTKICHIFMCNIFTTLNLLFLYYDPFWTGILILRLSTFGKNEFSSKVNKITNRIQNLIFTWQFWYRKTLYTGLKCVLVETFISTCHFSIKKKKEKKKIMDKLSNVWK